MTDPYLDLDAGALQNRLGITDSAELAQDEVELSALRLIELRAEPLPGAYDLDHLQDVLTTLLARLNLLHPFREGNGRTQRAFLAQLATDAGYLLRWTAMDREQNIAASRAAHDGDLQPLRAMLAPLVHPLDELPHGEPDSR
ncbi:Fic/DOC family protein [Pseudonocardia sediminis]|uniref:protein adenylyltransferase n=1 Tax=Pseudonocardia sediminis TaxID=1397368 RepID=A0A4Q7UZM8_PSEST|nr:Fic family protein [Pseudonocardia sediminis]RZT86578.1 Fic/DOC family protein [Pseudonocardia sediminis]